MQIKPITSVIGAEVIGVDLLEPLDELMFKRIEQAWHDNVILLFRGQNLDENQQASFCARFGKLVASLNAEMLNRPGQHPAVMYISNIVENGKLIGALPDGEVVFHSDQCHAECPAMATMLYALEIPFSGGDTLFANMYAAYDSLPLDLKNKLNGRYAENVYDYAPETIARGGSRIREGVKHWAHPVFRTHPVTGKKALYVNRLMTDHIVGLPEFESREILDFLFIHVEQPEFVYSHHWAVGDLMLWDNRCSLHARTNFDASARRKLRRITVQGERPS